MAGNWLANVWTQPYSVLVANVWTQPLSDWWPTFGYTACNWLANVLGATIFQTGGQRSTTPFVIGWPTFGRNRYLFGLELVLYLLNAGDGAAQVKARAESMYSITGAGASCSVVVD